MSDISKRLELLHQRVSKACEAAGRSLTDVSILAVAKTQPSSSIAAALTSGQQHFGENYLQEALPKIAALPSANWHFIGAIQSNKIREIAENFDWVHSIGSMKVARRLSEQRPADRNPLKVMIQINISGEGSKAGVAPAAARLLASDISALPNLSLQGFMAIPESSNTFEQQRQPFRQLREIRDDIAATLGMQLPHLSMGMTGDFAAAILEGATWIRIGTAIFGPRINSGDIE